jgi:hypothetical protein
MKISWSYKITFLYLSFVTGILFLVYKAANEDYDLVTEQYYEAELKYQDVIDQKERVAKLSAPLQIKSSVDNISVQFPKEFSNKQIKGELYLYRPSDDQQDIRKRFTTSEAFYETAFGCDLSGLYEIKLSWESEGKTYFYEQKKFF